MFIIALILSILFLAWGSIVEPNTIKTEKIKVKIKNLPLSFLGTKLVHITDIHSRKFGRTEKKILNIVKKTNPDYIFITGDFLNWGVLKWWVNLESCFKFWKKLAENYQGKIFAVFGNHEHTDPRFEEIKKLLGETNIRVLTNESIKLKRNNDFLWLVGVDDPYKRHDDIEKAMDGTNNDRPKILLAHSPEIFRKAKNKDIDFILTGHTHGAQINLPIIDNFTIPVKYDKKYKRGLFEENLTRLYVSRGIGNSGFPFRFKSFPEVTIITLS